MCAMESSNIVADGNGANTNFKTEEKGVSLAFNAKVENEES